MNTVKCDLCLILHNMCCKMVWKFCEIWKSYGNLQNAPLNKVLQTRAVAGLDVHASTWYADGRMFDDHVRQHSFIEIGHKIRSTAVLSLPLIQLLMKGTG